jgi:hypothetical protein
MKSFRFIFLLLVLVLTVFSCSSEGELHEILGLDSETNAPVFLDCRPISPTEVVFNFSHPVTVVSVGFEPSLEIDSVEDGNEVKVTFSGNIEAGMKITADILVEDSKKDTLNVIVPFRARNDRMPALVFNELRTEYSKPKAEFVEFRSMGAGNLGAMRLFIAGYSLSEPIYEFPPVEVAAGEYLVFHLRTLEDGCVDETGSNLALSGGTDAHDKARDFWLPNSSEMLRKTDALWLMDQDDRIIDAVIFSENPGASWSNNKVAEAAKFLGEKKAWHPLSKGDDGNEDWVPSPDDVFISKGTTTTKTICRDESLPAEPRAGNWYITATNGLTPGEKNKSSNDGVQQNSGSGNSGTNNSGTGNTGSGNSGKNNTGAGNTGTSNTGTGNSGTGNSGANNPSTTNSGTNSSGTGNTGTGNSGTGNTGTGNSGTGNSGTGNTGTGNSGTGNSGTNNSGTNNSGSGNKTPAPVETPPPVEMPDFLRYRAVSSTEVIFEFSLPIRLDSITFDPHLEPLSITEGRELRITFGESLDEGKSFTADIQIKDSSGKSHNHIIPFSARNDRMPALVFNELRTEYTKDKPEFVEFLTLGPGNMGGMKFFISYHSLSEPVYVFPQTEVKAGEYVVLHLRTPDESCIDEIGSDLTLSGGIDAHSEARDLWLPVSTKILHKTDVLWLMDQDDKIIDALVLCEKPTDWGKNNSTAAAEFLGRNGAWFPSVDPAAAVISSGTTNTRTICRDETIPHSLRADNWYIAATSNATPGKPNSSKRYTP